MATSFQEALAAGQEAYNSAYSSSVEDSYNSLTDEQKANINAVESSMARSGRDASFQEKENPEIVEYLRLRDAESQLDLSTLMYGGKTMGRKREDIDFYGEDSPYRKGANAQADVVKNYLEESDTPLYKELEDGTRLYLTTGTSAHFGAEPGGSGQWVQAGDVGTYSTYWEPKPKRSFLEGMIANPIFRTGLALATGGTSEALIQTGRAVSGEDLNSEDWASMITGNSPAVIAAKAAITGDPKAAIANLVLENTDIGASLAEAGFSENLTKDPDFIAGVAESLGEVAGGANLQDSLEAGLIEYVKEGGSLGIDLPEFDSPDFDLGVISDFAGNIINSIGDVTDPLFSAIGDAGEAFGDFADPVIQAGQDVIDAGSQVVGDVSSAVGDVIDPALGAIGDAGSAIGNVTDPMLSKIGDFAKDLLSAGQQQEKQQAAATRTTDGLFSDDLFKFSSRVELSPEQPLLQAQDRQAPQLIPQAPTPQLEIPQPEVDGLLEEEDPFASPFNIKV